jgi:hypothetical protein
MKIVVLISIQMITRPEWRSREPLAFLLIFAMILLSTASFVTSSPRPMWRGIWVAFRSYVVI